MENININIKETAFGISENQYKIDLLFGIYDMDISSAKVKWSVRLSETSFWTLLWCIRAAQQELLLCAVLKTEEKCKKTLKVLHGLWNPPVNAWEERLSTSAGVWIAE